MADPRINPDEVDEEGRALEEIIGTGLPYPLGASKTGTALKLIQDARNRSNSKNRQKAVIFVLNSEYSKAKLESLQGQNEDFQIGKKVFKDKHYAVHVIKDSEDILEDVCTLVETEEFKESAADIFQLVYSGHGIHKTMAEKGKPNAMNDEEAEYKQRGKLGDCLVNTDGSECSELELALNIAEALSENTRICLFYDMCRSQSKVCIFINKSLISFCIFRRFKRRSS